MVITSIEEFKGNIFNTIICFITISPPPLSFKTITELLPLLYALFKLLKRFFQIISKVNIYCVINVPAAAKKKYPDVVVESERCLVCSCKEKVVLNKLRSLPNYSKRK